VTVSHAPGRNKRGRNLSRFEFCLADQENELFRKAAVAAHLTLSAWIRTRLHAAAKREGVRLEPKTEKPSEG
jgi:hypothetical protein